MKRKLSALAIITCLSAALAGCGQTTNTASTEPKETETPTADTGPGTASDAKWEAMDKLKDLKDEKIESITVSIATEGGAQRTIVDDSDEIDIICSLLKGVEIKEKTDMAVDDDGLRIEVSTDSETLRFDFEHDILVLSDKERYTVSQISPLKSYVNKLLEEEEGPSGTAPKGDPKEPTGKGGGTLVNGTFTNGSGTVSLDVEPTNSVQEEKDGAITVTVPGGGYLEVRVADSTSLPEISQIIEEDMFDVEQTYQNRLADKPAKHDGIIGTHNLYGFMYTYSTADGQTFDVAEHIESRDGKYVFYHTEVERNASDYWGSEEAMEKAVRTLVLK